LELYSVNFGLCQHQNVNLCDMAALGVSSCDLQQIPQDKPELLGRPGKRRENTLHGDWVLDAAMPKRADYATIRAYTKALPAFTKHIASGSVAGFFEQVKSRDFLTLTVQISHEENQIHRGPDDW